ncbi:MAG: hypothetical protein AAB725_03080 [Patescibacteria group bacterium]
MLEREGGYIPPLEEQKIETEQSEAQKSAEKFLRQETEKADERENTIYTPNRERIDLSSVTGPNDLSPEQRTNLEQTVGSADFTNYKAAAEITEKLLDTQIIDAGKAKSVVWNMLKQNGERFVPQELLDKIARQDRSFALSMGEQGQKTAEKLASFVNKPGLEDGKLAYAVKALKYRGMSPEISKLQEKRELVEIKNEALKNIFEPSEKRNAFDQRVEQMKLLTARNYRDVFESGVISRETISTMIKNTFDFFRNNPQFIQGDLPKIRETITDLVRMGKLDQEKAKELLTESYEITKG